jgi:2',3'-cyclic-nucleotide 2'-phosphodiesterase (5'-nucleotidase family)
VNDVYRLGGIDRGNRGGLARLRTLRRELEREDPNLILLHAGDTLFPSMMSTRYNGEQMVAVLNLLDGREHAFDDRLFITFGNHEFEKRKLGDARILNDRVRESQFRWVRTNGKRRAVTAL